jgi:hypothetical protein
LTAFDSYFLRFFHRPSGNIEGIYCEAGRPTGNAVKERYYRTFKQEDYYRHDDGYLTMGTAIECIREYNDGYNNERPHSFIYNFTPHQMHYEIQNMSLAGQIYRQGVLSAIKRRVEYYKAA